jgi:hypothetical protein
MTLDTFTVSGGNTEWRVWCGSELVATFPTLNKAWDALKAAREAVQQLERI